MSASFDITTLTFNQWLLVSVIVIASLLLIFWVLALVLSSGFRRSVMTFDESCNKLPEHERTALANQEMYEIWFGRILELWDRITGGARKRIGWQHFISVLTWILLFTSIAGFFSGIYVQAFWKCCFIGIIVLTYMYSQWVSVLVRPDSGK